MTKRKDMMTKHNTSVAEDILEEQGYVKMWGAMYLSDNTDMRSFVISAGFSESKAVIERFIADSAIGADRYRIFAVWVHSSEGLHHG